MASTLLVGDHVLADRASLAPPASGLRLIPYRPLQRNEPVVFYKPVLEPDGTNLTLVKRVVGLPGDRIHLRDGILYLNGVAQNEPYAGKPSAANFDPYRDDFPAISPDRNPLVTATWTLELPKHIDGPDLVVPPDSYFVMGDNRTISLDEPLTAGFVPRANLIGCARSSSTGRLPRPKRTATPPSVKRPRSSSATSPTSPPTPAGPAPSSPFAKPGVVPKGCRINPYVVILDCAFAVQNLSICAPDQQRALA